MLSSFVSFYSESMIEFTVALHKNTIVRKRYLIIHSATFNLDICGFQTDWQLICMSNALMLLKPLTMSLCPVYPVNLYPLMYIFPDQSIKTPLWVHKHQVEAMPKWWRDCWSKKNKQWEIMWISNLLWGK